MEIAALNQLDMIILSIIVVSATISLFRGFVKEAFSLILWISAFFLTILFQPSAQKFLSNFSISVSLLEPLTYIIVFVSLIFLGIPTVQRYTKRREHLKTAVENSSNKEFDAVDSSLLDLGQKRTTTL